MKSSGYPVLDKAIDRITKEERYTVVFTEEDILNIVQNDPKMKLIIQNVDDGLYEIMRMVSEELMSLQISIENAEYPVMNLVKCCSYNKELEIDFNEKAINTLIGSLKEEC